MVKMVYVYPLTSSIIQVWASLGAHKRPHSMTLISNSSNNHTAWTFRIHWKQVLLLLIGTSEPSAYCPTIVEGGDNACARWTNCRRSRSVDSCTKEQQLLGASPNQYTILSMDTPSSGAAAATVVSVGDYTLASSRSYASALSPSSSSASPSSPSSVASPNSRASNMSPQSNA
uniref:Uncharacterized protein n=1 Tax=Anopheles maculatus TaxID=74869 RepID=A0A182SN73_9DIPT